MKNLLILPLAALLVTGSASAADQPPYAVTFEGGVTLKTRDGVTLRADIYRPKADGKFPVLIRRSPYNKYSAIGDGISQASRGYVYIAQDVRGRESSEGEWYPFKHEAADGYDTVEWAASLPYSSGKVGLLSGSYEGITQLFAAMAAPPHLVTMYPGVAPSGMYEQLAYNDGAFMLALAQAWSGALSVNEFARHLSPGSNAKYWDAMHAPADYHLLDMGRREEVGLYYHDWIKHPDFDDYWKAFSFEQNYEKFTVPALHWGAWYDLFLVGTIKNYMGIKARGGTEAARRGQRLLITPGGHAGMGPKIGDVDFGAASVPKLGDYGNRWFDWHLKGIDDGISKEKPVRIFVMGENVYRDEDDWPLARAVSTRFHLHSGGRANSASGDGLISRDAPGAEPADRFVYDPAKPVPTLGGAILGITQPPAGPYDQRPIETREDVLVYTSAPFEQPMEVTGPLALEAYISSSAVDTDLVGKLVDVYPDGKAINLSEGVLRLRYRDSFERQELMQPGRIYKVAVDLWATSNVFLPGHRLRLEITSSSYPRFDRNLNTGASTLLSTEAVKATNLIHHDRDHPTALILPVIPR